MLVQNEPNTLLTILYYTTHDRSLMNNAGLALCSFIFVFTTCITFTWKPANTRTVILALAEVYLRRERRA